MNRVSDRIDSLGYEEPKGLLFLREQLSTYLKTIGIEASPSSILIVSGALQALQLISIGLLHRGSTIFLEKPSYLHSLHVFQSAGMRLFGLPLDGEGIQTKMIAQQKKRQNASLIYTIPSFHNPTGILMSKERRRELAASSFKSYRQQWTCFIFRKHIENIESWFAHWLDRWARTCNRAISRYQNANGLWIEFLISMGCGGMAIKWIVSPTFRKSQNRIEGAQRCHD